MLGRSQVRVRRPPVIAAVSAVVVVLLAGLAPTAAHDPKQPASVVPARPNIVLVLTDDMRRDELRHLPHIRRLLVRRGVTYTHAISPHPLCCPARAILATGQYGQNNGVRHNQGAWGGYAALRHPRNTIARWLHRSGYRTGFHGKYLNLYQRHGRRPPGWDVWQPQLSAMYAYGERPTRFAGGITFRDTYVTTAIRRLTRRSVAGALRQDRPFFEWINHVAPHPYVDGRGENREVQQHPRYERRYADEYRDLLPRVIREGDFDGSRADRRFLVEHARARLRALRSVDAAVADLVRQLRRAGELDDTYLVFTSDNGYQLGEQGVLGKNRLYEGSTRVPLVVRGPGIGPGTRDHTLVSLVDLVPTLVGWAGAEPGRRLDGLPFDRVGERRDTLLMLTGDTRRDRSPGWWWRGVRTTDYAYAARAGHPGTGFLYAMVRDPAQRTNLIHRPRYAPVRRELRRRTRILAECSGPAECNRVFGPLPDVA